MTKFGLQSHSGDLSVADPHVQFLHPQPKRIQTAAPVAQPLVFGGARQTFFVALGAFGGVFVLLFLKQAASKLCGSGEDANTMELDDMMVRAPSCWSGARAGVRVAAGGRRDSGWRTDSDTDTDHTQTLTGRVALLRWHLIAFDVQI
jgi:hypothetical protein